MLEGSSQLIARVNAGTMPYCKFFGTALESGDYSQSPLKVIERQKVSLLWADQAEPSIPQLTGNQMGKICSSQLSQLELNHCECGALT